MIGICDKVAAGMGAPAEVQKNLPMTRARCQHDQLFMLAEIVDKGNRLLHGGRWIEDTGVRYDTQAATQCQFRYGTADRRVELLFQPPAVLRVPVGLFSVCIDQYVDIEQDHRRSITSSRFVELSRSMPGRTP